MSTDFQSFLSWEKFSRDTIDVKTIYIDMAGDIAAGILLSQIVYWYLPSKDGKSKITVIKEGKEWIAKARYEWWDECRITPKQVDRAIGDLVELGILETKVFKFDNSPTKHIRIVKDTFVQLWNALTLDPMINPFLPKREEPNYPKVEIEIPPTVKTLTETTSEITEENKNIASLSDAHAPIPANPSTSKENGNSPHEIAKTPETPTVPPAPPLKVKPQAKKSNVVKFPELVKPVQDAIVAAFIAAGLWAKDYIGRTEYKAAGKVAQRLCDEPIPVQPEEIPALLKFCLKGRKSNGEPFQVYYIPGNVAAWRASQPAPARKEPEVVTLTPEEDAARLHNMAELNEQIGLNKMPPLPKGIAS